jgi:hypothetical protein
VQKTGGAIAGAVVPCSRRISWRRRSTSNERASAGKRYFPEDKRGGGANSALAAVIHATIFW